MPKKGVSYIYMSVFKVEYHLDGDERLHVRSYQALSESIALAMFEETVESGSLTGEIPEIIKVVESVKTSDSSE